MRRIYLILFVINMALFQIAGTGLVRLCSQHLVAQQHIALEAGYGPLPDAGREEELTSWRFTLAAGLFYSFSLGTGLTVLETACIAILAHIFTSLAWSLAVFSIFALSLLLYVGSISTPALWTTGAFFISLLATLGLLLREQKNKRFNLAFQFRSHCLFVPLIIAIIIIIAYMSGVRDFVAVRDLLLLPHSMGRKITDFYYNHTLMAARPLESIAQKSWLLAGADSSDFSPEQWNRMQSLLLEKGIFLVSTKPSSRQAWYDLNVKNREGKVFVSSALNGPTRALPLDTGSGSLSGMLNKLSQDFDPMRPLKQVLIVCIGIGCPLFFLTITAQLIIWIFNLTVRRLNIIVVIPIWVCAGALLIGLVVTGPGRSLPLNKESLNHLAWQGDAFQRVKAARRLAEAAEKGDLREVFLKLTEHPDFRIRIWAAQGLSYYAGHEVTDALLKLSRDVHLTVVTSSIYALSRQPDVIVREALMSLYTNYPQSYVRDAAFRALRRRGWLEKIPKSGVGGDACF